MKEIFTDIVLNNKWKKHPCGPGSTMAYTENLRKALVPFLKLHNIKSILDLPCGDFSWMSTTGITNDFNYIGADIVEPMIQANKEKYPDVDFRILDLTTDSLPEVDLLFCRDCLLHLSFDDIDRAFKNIIDSNIKYILMSTWFESATNERDIDTGKWRYIDFTKSPYNFSKSTESLSDWVHGFPRREMMLWPVETIKKYIQDKGE
tara:strand:- start:1467 stop:2081 length:615 start_codon:yes stop_codon:yes gene_type:complete